jgi:hypothetical protein
MPINRFSTVGQSEYTPQYVPLPFQQLAALGEQAKKDFDEGKKLESDLDALTASIKAAPVYEESRKAYADKVNASIRNLIEEAKGDYGSSDFKSKTNRLINQVKNSTELANFNKTLEAYNIWEKLKAQGNSKDLDYTYEMDPNDPNKFKQLDILQNPIYSSKITKYSDWDKDAKEAVGSLRASGNANLGEWAAKTKYEGGTLYEKVNGRWQGVTDSQLAKVAKGIIPVYASKSGGQHHLESILKDDYGYGNNAYNVSYRDIENQANEANQRIANNNATEKDYAAVEMKKDIDSKLYNYIVASNKHQVGVVYNKDSEEKFLNDPSKGGSGQGKEEEDKVLKELNLASPTAQVFNKNANLKKIMPNTSFEFDESGNVKVADGYGSKLNINIKGPNGKVWKEGLNSDGSLVFKNKKEALAAGVNPALLQSVSDDILAFDSQGHNAIIITSGGTVVKPNSLGKMSSYKIDVQSIPNTELRNQQMTEVLSYAMKNNLIQPGEKGYATYQRILPIYSNALKAASGDKQVAVPLIQGENAEQFEKYYFDRDKKENSTTVGRTGDWTLMGSEDKKGTEAHNKIIQTLKENGKIVKFRPDLEGGDYFEVEDTDGKHHVVKMNNKTIQATNKPISDFVRSNKKNLINSEEDYSLIRSNLSQVANFWNVNSNNLTQNINNLEQSGLNPLSTYQNPLTGVYAVSFSDPMNPANVKVLEVNSRGESNIYDESVFIGKEFQLTSYQKLNTLVGKGSKGESETTIDLSK